MKKLLVCLLAALCLLAACAVAEGFDTPKDIAQSYIDLCANALNSMPGLPECREAFPALIEELAGFLDPDCDVAMNLGQAAEAMLQEGDESARQARDLLYSASWHLREEDIRTPFGLADLNAALQYDLLPIGDTAQFIDVFNRKAATGSDCFLMVCDGQLREALNGSTTYREDTSLMVDIACQCGISSYRQLYNDNHHMLIYHDMVRYAGTRILQACRNNGAAGLTGDERATLDAALEIANAASGSPLEVERQIHDALCRRITYYADDDFDGRNDCAIGALLDGMADCDGYSDAFFLCGSLAGLQIRYIKGDSVEKQDDDAPDVGHVWNMICQDGSWVHVDVTWDDKEELICYTNYNIGAESMGTSHLWDDRTQITGMQPATLNRFRSPEQAFTEIGSWAELYDYCRQVTPERPERLFISLARGLDPKDGTDEMADTLYSTGIKSYRWYHQNGMLELTKLQYSPEFIICDTAEEAAAFIADCADRNIREFTLYFSRELCPWMFADDHAGIADLISASPLVGTQYTYNEQYGRVGIEGAEYDTARPVAKSMDDVRAILRDTARERRDGVQLVLPAGADMDALSLQLPDILYSAGVQSYSWSTSGRRLSVSDLVYYPEFAMVEDEEQLRGYVRACKTAGITDFRAYCPQVLYDSMSADSFSRFYELLRQEGCHVDGISYNEDYATLVVKEATW